jgi:hypothetical protein
MHYQRKDLPVKIPAEWMGPNGHLLQEPWVPSFFSDGLAALITELDAAAPPGLANTRTAFKQQGQINKTGKLSSLQRQEVGMDQLLALRAELLVGVKLLRAGVLERISKETPDFECRWQQTEFGVEVTTRARPEAGSAMHDLLEKGLQEGPDVGVTLTRTGALLFSESPETTAGIADQVIASIKEFVATAAGGPVSGSIPIPDLGLTAMVHNGGPVSGPGMRVTYEPLLTDDLWDHHWKWAARQIKDRVEEKGRKTYALPSILVLDVSRLGYAGQMLTPAATAKFQEELDGCELGNLRGVLVVRSQLTAEILEALSWRGDGSFPVSLAAGAVLLSTQMPKAP